MKSCLVAGISGQWMWVPVQAIIHCLYVLGKPLTLFSLLVNGDDNGLTLLKFVNYSKWKIVIMSSTERAQAGTENTVFVIIVKLLRRAQVFCEPVGLLCPWDFPGKSTGVGCHFLLQGIFLAQGSNLCLLH